MLLDRLLAMVGLERSSGPPAESWLARLIREAASSTGGAGVSSTKLVWLSNGMLACYCATLMTVGGVAVYVFQRHADYVYWTATSGMWTITLGFASGVKRSQVRATKEITIANNQAEKPRTEDEGGKS